VATDEFADGEVVYFITDVRQKNPMRVYDRANSRPDEIRCLRRRPNGKELPETFAPEHLRRHVERNLNQRQHAR
jgi:hypothetical protein